MKRPRPYIPLAVRIKVLDRQLRSSQATTEHVLRWNEWFAARGFKFKTKTIQRGLELLFGPRAKVQLDHDPALILRPFNKRTAEYDPPANDPDFLIYRTTEDHGKKTTGRNPGAARTITTKGSDIWLKTKFARLEKSPRASSRNWKATSKKKIPSRPFPKQSRRFGAASATKKPSSKR